MPAQSSYRPNIVPDTSQTSPNIVQMRTRLGGLPLLFDEFLGGPPRAQTTNKTRGVLDKTIQRYVLWGRSQGRSHRDLADEVGLAVRTVQRFVSRARKDLRVFVDCEFVQKTGKGYFCRHCGDLLTTKAAAGKHGFGHVWDAGLLDLEPMDRGPYMLALKKAKAELGVD